MNQKLFDECSDKFKEELEQLVCGFWFVYTVLPPSSFLPLPPLLHSSPSPPLREAKVIKKREDTWTALEKLALMSPHVEKLSSPQNAFRKSMLSSLASIASEEPMSPDGVLTSEDVKTTAQAVVSKRMIIIILLLGVFLDSVKMRIIIIFCTSWKWADLDIIISFFATPEK